MGFLLPIPKIGSSHSRCFVLCLLQQMQILHQLRTEESEKENPRDESALQRLRCAPTSCDSFSL